MATPKKTTTASPRKRQTAKRTSSGAASANGRAPKSSGRSTTSRRTNASRTTQASSSRNGASSPRTTQRAAARNGVAEKLKSVGGDVLHAVDRGAKPALAIGATAAGIAGGIALSRRQRSTVFGIPVPHGTDGIDVVAISRAVGKASLQLGQTAKNLSKDIDNAAERAEKIGKILS